MQKRRKRVAVGFYRDDENTTRPITKSTAELNRKKVIQNPKKFRGVKPKVRDERYDWEKYLKKAVGIEIWTNKGKVLDQEASDKWRREARRLILEGKVERLLLTDKNGYTIFDNEPKVKEVGKIKRGTLTDFATWLKKQSESRLKRELGKDWQDETALWDLYEEDTYEAKPDREHEEAVKQYAKLLEKGVVCSQKSFRPNTKSKEVPDLVKRVVNALWNGVKYKVTRADFLSDVQIVRHPDGEWSVEAPWGAWKGEKRMKEMVGDVKTQFQKKRENIRRIMKVEREKRYQRHRKEGHTMKDADGLARAFMAGVESAFDHRLFSPEWQRKFERNPESTVKRSKNAFITTLRDEGLPLNETIEMVRGHFAGLAHPDYKKLMAVKPQPWEW